MYVFTLFQYSNFNLYVHLSICMVSSKEIKLHLSDSSFMLTLCNCRPKYTNTGNLQCDLVIFIRHYF